MKALLDSRWSYLALFFACLVGIDTSDGVWQAVFFVEAILMLLIYFMLSFDL